MKTILMVTSLLLVTQSGFAAGKCLGDKELEGRSEMMASMRKGQWEAFKKQYADLCQKHQDHLVCKTETVAKSDVKQKSMELVKGHGCAQVTAVPSSDSTKSDLYFIDQK